MKLAFISDIHANLPALLTVMGDIKKHKPDDIYCLGDLVNFAGWDNEVIEAVRYYGITCLQGNHDEGIAYKKSSFPFSFKTEAEKKFGYESIKLVNETITSDNRSFLLSLPFMLQIQFRFPFQQIKVAMVHGSTLSNTEYIKEDCYEEYLLEMMDSVEADILLMGHTHIPYHKSIFCEEANRKIYRHAINVGSVGKPKHGDNKSCYTLLEIDHNSDLSSPDTVKVSFHYVDYDVQKTIAHIHEIGLSNAYDDFLKM
ncbi:MULTISPECIES: metallophosphoesterase family protein [Chryseobacterium]|uniref:Phosphodiesterase n=2 Tax=Chryseobacterium gleum TaxID=250 RepID=A0A448B8Z0_CHRGE|nr:MULTISPECIES: metallophosphoesterase family protein [Chryseobacterium]EFK36144.1 phosphodiesterase family protein [Chryseobacterium gleum ATCC 35910]QQY31842.1 metallophosphoesterase family protein [Chryseobacterium gleum]VEE11043.1 phosphodiesterase [Chryseobacterium gleum]VFA43930.1 phosphodiesterase [Chryseobacterium indologenes]